MQVKPRNGNRKLLQLATALWVWWAVLVISVNSASLDTEDAGKGDYSGFLVQIRNQLKGTAPPAFGIPVMRKPPVLPATQRFILVDLIAGADKTVTLAVDVENAYVVAYRDKLQGKDRAHFFSDAPVVAKSAVFVGATQVTIPFASTYTALERLAGDRTKIDLGIEKLRFAIQSVHGKATIDQKLEAKFLLIAIQMVSEAARFKYIENKVLGAITGPGIYSSFFPDPFVISLETTWGGLSKAIQASKNGDITPSIQLKDPNNQPLVVKKVTDISAHLGILKYEGK